MYRSSNPVAETSNLSSEVDAEECGSRDGTIERIQSLPTSSCSSEAQLADEEREPSHDRLANVINSIAESFTMQF